MDIKKIRAILLIIALFSSGLTICLTTIQPAKAENFGTNVQVSDHSGMTPEIAVDSTGNIYIVWRAENHALYCAKSTDGGDTFFSPIPNLPHGERGYITKEGFNPAIAIDDSDNLHMAFDWDNKIFYTNSTDGATTFSTPVMVNDTVTGGSYDEEGWHDEPDIATFGNNVYICWDTSYESAAEDNISFDKSINGGSFGTDVRVNDADGTVYGGGFPSIAIDEDETIYVVWEDERLELHNYHVYIATSIDQGDSFGSSMRVDDSDQTHNPAVATMGTNTVYVSYQASSAEENDGQIRCSKSTDDGATFSPSVAVSDEVNPDIGLHGFISSITVHPCGKIFVAWRDSRNGNDGEIYFANSTDGGISFGTDVKVNDAPPAKSNYEHTHPSIAVGSDTEVYTVWEDEREPDRAYFAKAPDATWPSKITDLKAVNATVSSITLEWTAPGDNLELGTASSYEIRYSTSQITDTNWKDVTPVSTIPTPQEAGNSETFNVTGLDEDTLYYFAIKTSDEIPNTSPLSNIVSKKTLVKEEGGGGIPGFEMVFLIIAITASMILSRRRNKRNQ